MAPATQRRRARPKHPGLLLPPSYELLQHLSIQLGIRKGKNCSRLPAADISFLILLGFSKRYSLGQLEAPSIEVTKLSRPVIIDTYIVSSTGSDFNEPLEPKYSFPKNNHTLNQLVI